jgi:hypothetical protein
MVLLCKMIRCNVMTDDEPLTKKKRQTRSQQKKKKKKKDECNEADDLERLFVGNKTKQEENQSKSEAPSIKPEVPDIPEIPLNCSVAAKPKEVPAAQSSSGATEANKQPVTSDLDKDKDAATKGRHDIRRLVGKLGEQTKIAGKMEAERRERVKKLREKVFSSASVNAAEQLLIVLNPFVYYTFYVTDGKSMDTAEGLKGVCVSKA